MPEKEQNLLKYIRNHPNLAQIKGNPDLVLKAIDDYSESLMTVGQLKGKVVLEQLSSIKNPKIVLELGGYVGYSAIYFSQHLGSDGKYYSFEVNEEFAAIAQELIDLAGLTSKVQIILGPAGKTLEPFAQEKKTKADLIFIDHWKDLYVPDFRVLETVGLIGKGTIITADNILHPGAPEYAKYVKLSPAERKAYNEENENESGNYPGKWQNEYKSETVIVDGANFTDGVEVTHAL